jgi:D-serine deaminase-like pyridoxal phosphate-dependent protein
MEGMAAVGLGADLLLANEVVDARRLTPLVADGARITVAVDSPETVTAALAAAIREVLIDVNVGLPRCGCAPEAAGELADLARRQGLEVRGVMGYEGHAVGVEDRAERARLVEESMALLRSAHRDVGGPVVSAGGTGSFDLNTTATEIQAGSYALMDTAYARLDLPFQPALSLLATVVSVNRAGWAVADCGLKALGMDHGNPALVDGGQVWFCSDEHVVFAPEEGEPLPAVGALIRLLPAHVDPTVAYHRVLHLVDAAADRVVETWPVDLRSW